MAAMEDLSSRFWSELRKRNRLMAGDRADRLKFEAADFPALDEVDELVRAEAPDTIAVLVELAETAPDEEGLAAMAAGPVSEVLYFHAIPFLVDIEAASRKSPKFRTILKLAFWGWSGIPDSVRTKLEPLLEPGL